MKRDNKNNKRNYNDNGQGRETHDGIELRSEKVRGLIGEVPPSLVRWGTAVIVTVFAALIAAVCLLPYPYSNGESILRHMLGI